jgi:hypothetical protein
MCRITSFSHFSLNFLYLTLQSAAASAHDTRFARANQSSRSSAVSRFCNGCCAGLSQQHRSPTVLHRRVAGVHALYLKPSQMRLAPADASQQGFAPKRR